MKISNRGGPSAAALSLISAAFVLMAASCSPTDPLTLLRCRFRIENTEDFSVTGIQLDSLNELSVSQIADVVAVWSSGSCPVDFTLNVGIFNPNDGSTGPDIIPAQLTSLEWDLYLDSESGTGYDTTWVASGLMADTLEVPGTGETVVLPLEIGFDAVALMGEIGVMNFIDLALAIGGIDSDLRDEEHLGRVLMVALPTVSTPFGEINYPGTLNIGLDWVY
ncbi:MAG: hypothetical protein GF388_10425 [Candidatus Aegiribacteria sp.]|nr:hypothetical protein [Candidatus Aegiribacteria sp.]MBD3295439.1 hypothetical protein [Candidatus Fermentibacteria bacterium]